LILRRLDVALAISRLLAIVETLAARPPRQSLFGLGRSRRDTGNADADAGGGQNAEKSENTENPL